jgi:hypothetical protein
LQGDHLIAKPSFTMRRDAELELFASTQASPRGLNKAVKMYESRVQLSEHRATYKAVKSA